MLVTQQPVLRRFWYPVAPVEQLLETPTSFELLGEKLVVWRNQAGQPAVLRDRCCHRSAQLSLGKLKTAISAVRITGGRLTPKGIVSTYLRFLKTVLSPLAIRSKPIAAANVMVMPGSA